MFKSMGGKIPGGNFPGESLMGGNFPGGSFPDIQETTIKTLCYSFMVLLLILINYKCKTFQVI